MKKLIIIFICSIITFFVDAQPPKPAVDVSKMMIDQMKKMGMSQQEIDEALKALNAAKPGIDQAGKSMVASAVDFNMPAKQVKLLTGIPVLHNEAEAKIYINRLAQEAYANIDADIKTKTDLLLVNSGYDKSLGLALLMKGYAIPAMYAMLRISEKYSGDELVQNNLGFILSQCGYPQKSIPLFSKLLQSSKESTAVLNNLAQCYLALGDADNATKFFLKGLAIDSTNFELNLGIGFIKSAEGKTTEANIYIKKALQNGYSPVAEELAKKTKLYITLDDINLPQVPEYFNPYKIKPVENAEHWNEIKQMNADIQGLDDLLSDWLKKKQKLEEENKMSESELVNKGASVLFSPFFKKARYMNQLIYNSKTSLFKNFPYAAKTKEIEDQFLIALKTRPHDHDGETSEQYCKSVTKIVDNYLKNTKENHDAAVRAVLPKIYQLANQSVYWNMFLLTPEQYHVYYSDEVIELIHRVQSFNQLLALSPDAASISLHCGDYEEMAKKGKKDSLDESRDCPVNFRINTPIGAYKLSCKGEEFEGGELFKFSINNDFKSGEWELAFGLGADLNGLGLSAGGKGMAFFRFGKDLMPCDIGMKGEIGVEANLGFINVEEKLTGAMGISSINVQAVHQGKQMNIFTVDATKD